jgi:ribosomal protein L44E
MRRINPGSVNSYIRYGNVKIPKSIQSECPQCRNITEFMINANFQSSKNGLLTESSCPTCKKSTVFIIMTKDGQDEQNEHADTYIYDIQASKHLINHLESLPNIPKDLIRAYRSAINVFESRENSATAVMSKRVIESILKHFLKEKSKGQPLSQQLEILPNQVDLAKPIQSLSHLLATDGSLHRMLELENEMDYETTALLMDLLESLIEYLFVLPGKIEVTHNKIAKKFH